MPCIISHGSPDTVIDDNALRRHLDILLAQMSSSLSSVLLVPPDITRHNSRAGDITAYLYQKLTAKKTAVDILPALGTHAPMSEAESAEMFGSAIPHRALLCHDWRNETAVAGTVSRERIQELSRGKIDIPVDVAVNRRLLDNNYDLIVSIGQVLPHEVAGMSNYTKNIIVGLGGKSIIDTSHFLGAVTGMESIMGCADNPVRTLLDEAFTRFTGHLPIVFVLTVIEDTGGRKLMRGLFCGRDRACFEQAARLSARVNIVTLDKPLNTAVVYLPPQEYKSMWLGNKAIYRLRLAMADRGKLIVLGLGVACFGEDPRIDRLIRRHGYHGTARTLKAVESDDELRNNLAAAAHMIHGSTEGRFSVTWCPGPGLDRKTIEAAGYCYIPFAQAAAQYDPQRFTPGFNTLKNGEDIFFVNDPGRALWRVG